MEDIYIEQQQQFADSSVRKRGVSDPSKLQVDRPVFTQKEFDDGYDFHEDEKKTLKERLRACKRRCCFSSGKKTRDFFLRLFPFISLVRNYKFPDWIPGDIISGLTVGVLQLPQGVAYSLLASLPPINGLYVSFFPPLLYFFMGTSRHASVGTMGVTSIMVGSVVDREVLNYFSHINNTLDHYNDDQDMTQFKLGVATAITFLAGVWQMLMWISGLSLVVDYLSDTVISAFTCAASIHVISSQLKYIFGVDIQRHAEPLKLVKTYKDIVLNLFNTNVSELVISLICIASLVIVKECINARCRRSKLKVKIPVPVDLIVVVAGTVICYSLDMSEQFGVAIVEDIPTGIPVPKLPPPEYLISIRFIIDSFSLAVVGFAISISMGKYLAKLHDYEIDAEQELLAYGLCNTFSSFFNCFASCTSLSRSLVQESAGGNSQFASLLACGVVLVVMLYVGPLFYYLPKCVLACIIVVAMKGMYMQMGELRGLWKKSKYEFVIWLVTFQAVVLLGNDMGLMVGVGFALITVVFRTQRPYTCLLGNIPNTEIYQDKQKYQAVQEIPGLKIFHFEGSLYHANAEHFRKKLFELTETYPLKLKKKRQKQEKQMKKHKRRQDVLRTEEDKRAKKAEKQKRREMKLAGHRLQNDLDPNFICSIVDESEDDLDDIYAVSGARVTMNNFELRHIIIDCSSMVYIDSVGIKILKQIMTDCKEVGITVLLCECRVNLRELFHKHQLFEKLNSNVIYLTIHDAVIKATSATETVPSELTSSLPQPPSMCNMLDSVPVQLSMPYKPLTRSETACTTVALEMSPQKNEDQVSADDSAYNSAEKIRYAPERREAAVQYNSHSLASSEKLKFLSGTDMELPAELNANFRASTGQIYFPEKDEEFEIDFTLRTSVEGIPQTSDTVSGHFQADFSSAPSDPPHQQQQQQQQQIAEAPLIADFSAVEKQRSNSCLAEPLGQFEADFSTPKEQLEFPQVPLTVAQFNTESMEQLNMPQLFDDDEEPLSRTSSKRSSRKSRGYCNLACSAESSEC
ncbi:solute carrier family 26 member 6 [Lingula anatina]|uniref:Solute carrier family 26 member 6 n=1 Tax=Lingula anatina TaxID=7574 RepID=A0A1S3JGE4_LINAN|nr:solute carrier family 26 member 6 [Lingula anatina]|eukprot:XP_013408969.1 solute carrier family 26 member 6 [Lingula anatina]